MSEVDDSFREALAKWVTVRVIARLFETSTLVDFEIACGQYVFKVHKVVICAQSKYFLAPCGKDYAEGSKGRITFKAVDEEGGDAACDDPEAIKHMIDFFYYRDYTAENIKTSSAVKSGFPPSECARLDPWANVNTSWGGPVGYKTKNRGDARNFSKAETRPQRKTATSECADGNVVMHAKVFAAAVKYDVLALQELASIKFAAAASRNWNHATFADAVRVAYTTTSDNVRGLRDTVCETLHSHPSLLDKASFMTAARETDLLGEVARMAYGMPAVAKQEVVDEEVRCDDCGYVFWRTECKECLLGYNGCCSNACPDGCPGTDEGI
ncbi:hypothetical protein LTR17_010748 [Elasticomyces elasticus]|nr:hypothetical protein LTR17_010748 [Elasticomyces elasticus]